MIEEKYLKERMTKQNPFQVPEGYFDSFADQVMATLPERRQRAKRVMLRLWASAAACLVVAICSVAIYFSKISSNDMMEVSQVAVISDAYMDDAADYAMIDNTEIYACLADN